MDEFDALAISLIEASFEVENFDMDDSALAREYIRALYLQEVHGFRPPKLVEHLDTDTKEELGLQQNINQSTINQKENQIQEDNPDCYNRLRKAAQRTAWVAYIREVELPSHVRHTHGLPESDSDKIPVRRSDQQEATKEWVGYLLEVLDPLTFNRSGGTGIEKFVGLCAHCALQDIAPSGADDTIDYLYDGRTIPSGRTLSEYIRQLERKESDEEDDCGSYPEEVVDQFVDCFRNFFQLAAKFGFCQGRKQLVADTTPIPTSTTGDTAHTIGGSGPSRNPAQYGNQSFRFQFLAIVDSPCNFILSVEPYYQKNETADRLDDQLRRVTTDTNLEVDHVTCDKGYYNKEVFKTLRRRVGNDWVVCASRKGDISDLIESAKAYGKYEKVNPEIGQPPLKPRPQAFVSQLSEDSFGDHESGDQSSLASFNGDLDSISNDESDWEPFTDEDSANDLIAYVTGMELTKENKRKIHVCYRNRRQIEPIIGQNRENHLPYTESMDPAIRYYFMAMAAMFYNFHSLINEHPSPKYGVPLDVSAKEWLTAIRDATLST